MMISASQMHYVGETWIVFGMNDSRLEILSFSSLKPRNKISNKSSSRF
jgi:hypothetical protein